MNKQHRITPRISGDASKLRLSVKCISPLVAVFEFCLPYDKITSPKDCCTTKLEFPGCFNLNFQISWRARDVVVRLVTNLKNFPISRKALSYERNVIQEGDNWLVVLIEQNRILSVKINGYTLNDITPYSWSHKVNHFDLQKRILEEMFTPDWFLCGETQKHTHPAYQRWNLCCDLIQQGIRYPDHVDALPIITMMMLDNYALLECSHGNVDKGIFGKLSCYGHVNVLKRIRSEITNPEKFGDVMVEMTYAAWHLSRGHQISPAHEQGTADFTINIPGFPFPVFTDCKRVKKNTNDNRFHDIIKKANKQIKTSANGEKCFGLIAIDVTDKINVIRPLSDSLPSEIVHIGKLVKSAIMQHNTSISAAILQWNDFTILGKPPHEPTTVALRKRSHLIEHNQPINKLPVSSILEEIGNTVEFNICWQKPEI